VSDLDEALERFQAGALEYAGGLANHGPMAAEALLCLGHAAKLPAFVELYAPRLGARQLGQAMDASQRREALGRPERIPDWVATFERAVEEGPWQQVLGIACEELCDGLFAGATHGLLRVAHAVRALEDQESAPRRRELAFGLAYWAGRYQGLPGVPGAGARMDGEGGGGPARALSQIESVPEAERQAGLFFDAVRALDARPGFASAIEAIDTFQAATSGGLGQFIGELCRSAAGLYLANPQARVAYVHTLTAPSALRLIAAHLSEPTRVRAAGRAFQAVAALHAVSAGDSAANPELTDTVLDSEVMRASEDVREIRYHAACSLQEHAIKFSEACLREDALAPDPVFRLAAADAALRIDGVVARC